jgi:hypothetical protein
VRGCPRPRLLGLLAQAEVRYVSSVLWGEDSSLPAPVRQAFTYVEEGHPALREIPAHGWHENLLKGGNRVFGQGARRAVLFPAPLPEAVPPTWVSTPEDEFRYNNRFFIDRALAEASAHVTLIWHPWSLASSIPGCGCSNSPSGTCASGASSP